MGDRYLITGVQLAMFVGLGKQLERANLCNDIINNQYIGHSDKEVKEDTKLFIDVVTLYDFKKKEVDEK